MKPEPTPTPKPTPNPSVLQHELGEVLTRQRAFRAHLRRGQQLRGSARRLARSLVARSLVLLRQTVTHREGGLQLTLVVLLGVRLRVRRYAYG